MRNFIANIETKSAVAAAAPPFEQHAYDPQFCKVEIVADDAETANGVVEGYASVFGNIDLGGDIVEQGAFKKTLKERLNTGAIKLVDSHMAFREGTNAIIGVVTEAKEDQSYPLLQQARKRQKSEAFKQDYHKHRSGVEGCVSALARGNGMRTSRYIGNQKRHLQAVFWGTAANVKRTARWLAGCQPKRYRQAWNLNSGLVSASSGSLFTASRGSLFPALLLEPLVRIRFANSI